MRFPRPPARWARSLGAGLAIVLAPALVAGPAGAAARAASGTVAAAPGTTLAGTLEGPSGAGLDGMRITAVPSPGGSCTTVTACPSTYSGPGGAYELPGLAAGQYTIQVLDGARSVSVDAVTIPAAGEQSGVVLRLGPPAVPPGALARRSVRDLALLNAERARDGLAAGVVLNPRWSRECAAHDDYEAANHVLAAGEDPSAVDASAGGAWAGLNGDLAEGTWTAAAGPWQDAPVHLLALLAPSLSVTGIDDGGGFQCAITFPGMLRRPVTRDTVTTVPGAGASGVPPVELARESPFTPVQFAGLPAAQPTGRELFVYLNRAGELGQAPVAITAASLTLDGRPVAVRWVDSSTRTLGPYLAGGIIIPVAPLRAGSAYIARVTVQDGARTLTRGWTFRTR